MALEIAARLGIFAFVFAALAVWEMLAPRRQLTIGRLRRWPSNFGVLAVDALLVRLLIPTAAVGARSHGRRSRLGPVQLAAVASLGRRHPRLSDPRPDDLGAALAVPPRPVAVAAASHASRRPRHRRDHRRAFPSVRNSDLARDQDRGDRSVRHSAGRRVRVRGRAQRHLDVQPFQRADAGVRSTACFG